MIKLVTAAALVALAAPAYGQDESFVEPGTRPGPNEPIYTEGIHAGDKWARLQLSVDKRGKPTKCMILETNEKNKETRFWMCQAFMTDWHVEPIMENGVAVPGKVTRMFVMPGRSHPKVKKQAVQN